MRVNFSCGYRFVPQKFLYGFEVGAAINQVGGKRVAKRVRTYGHGQVALAGGEFDDCENHDTRQFSSAPVEKQHVAAVRCNQVVVFQRGPVAAEVKVDFGHGLFPNRDAARLVALALADHDVFFALYKFEVAHSEVDQFGDAQPAAVEDFEDGAVALAFGFGCIDGVD